MHQWKSVGIGRGENDRRLSFSIDAAADRSARTQKLSRLSRKYAANVYHGRGGKLYTTTAARYYITVYIIRERVGNRDILNWSVFVNGRRQTVVELFSIEYRSRVTVRECSGKCFEVRRRYESWVILCALYIIDYFRDGETSRFHRNTNRGRSFKVRRTHRSYYIVYIEYFRHLHI